MHATVDIGPWDALIDVPVGVRVSGADPWQRVTISIAADYGGARVWQSRADFSASQNGVVDVATDAPVGGCYMEVDEAGLLWSMTPEPATGQERRGLLEPAPITLSLHIGEQHVSYSVRRRFLEDGVTVTRIREDGLVGALFEPACRPAAAVVLFGGTDARAPSAQAAMLAARGFVAFAVNYFGTAGLPATISEIPVEYGRNAIGWLLARSSVAGERVGVVGYSKGAEYALLLATIDARIHSVVAYSPSTVVLSAPWGADRPRSSWTAGGTPVPFASGDHTVLKDAWSQPVLSLESFYRSVLADRSALETTRIPVEQASGPVLLISGSDDQMWPSADFGEIAAARAPNVEHLCLDGAGHAFVLPHLPATTRTAPVPGAGFELALGGQPADIARAGRVAWNRTIEHLRACAGSLRYGLA